MRHPPQGIENAVFDRSGRTWVFRESLPFWRGFAIDEGGDDAAADSAIDPSRADDSDDSASLAKLPSGVKLVAVLFVLFAKLFWLLVLPIRLVFTALRFVLRAVGLRAADADATGDDEEPQPGVVDVSFTGSNKDRINPAQRRAYEDFIKNQEELGRAIVAKVFDDYVHMRRERVTYGVSEDWPLIAGPDDLRSLIELGSVYVHPPDESGRCDIGLSFGCLWDEEHGYGVRLRDGQVLDNIFPEDAFDERFRR